MQTKLSFCIYLDVLGFNDRTKEAFKKGEGDALLQEFHNALSGNVETLKENSQYAGFTIKTFTDNIILTRPITSEDVESDVGRLITELVQFNLGMALAGFFIRGGWALDELYVSDEIIFGPAILRAYEIEKQQAVFPRIALDESVKSLLKKHLKFYSNPVSSPQNNCFLVDDDGIVFVDYLSETIDHGNYPWNPNCAAIEIHQKNIEKNLKKHQKDSKIYSKYKWLAGYHNFFIKRLAVEGGCDLKKYLIKVSSMTTLCDWFEAHSYSA